MSIKSAYREKSAHFNMLRLTVVCTVLVALAMGAKLPEMQEKKLADKTYLMKEKAVLQLLMHIQEPLMNPKLIDIANTYKIEEHKDKYTTKVDWFLWMWEKQAFLKRGEIFNPMDDAHLKQAITVFDLFYFSKDWDTMYQTAVWARQNLNEGLFAYSWMIALRHHAETKELVLPPLFEIVPHMFVRSEVMKKAYEMRILNLEKSDKDIITIPHNFSEWMHHKMHPEMRLAYFTEDFSLNEWNWEVHMQWPWWMMAKGSKYPIMFEYERLGEYMYFLQKQLLSRYRLERLSNNMEDIKKFKWTDDKLVGYAPHLHYKGGKEMPMRPDDMYLVDTDDIEIEEVKMMERNILDALKRGYIESPKKDYPLDGEMDYEYIYRIIDNTLTTPLMPTAPKQYGSLLRKLLVLAGRIADPLGKYQMAPSALMHWETQLRDPMYYSILDRVLNIYRKYMNVDKFPWEKLKLETVEIKSLETDRLVTYFENFDLELNNGIDVPTLDTDKKMTLVARNTRINHKPFNVRTVIQSKTAQPVMIHLYLSARRDMNGLEMNTLDKNEWTVEIDRFKMDLKEGDNTLERNSKEFAYFEEDKPSFRTLYKKIEEALQDKSPFYIEKEMLEVKYPEHLLLPKGKKNGMPFSLMMLVRKFEGGPEDRHIPIIGNGAVFTFPFNMEFHKEAFMTKNFMEKEIIIYHKKTDEIHESI